jgi:PTH1 family peptidyl-tRNA hydrolase
MSLPPTRFPLLIVSIGNPITKSPTYHDAGHVLLKALKREPVPSNWTLFSSGSYMNVCGPGIKKQWDRFRKQHADGARMIVLQDELELGVGKMRVSKGANSHRGHNGIRSIKEAFRSVDDGLWERVQIGIGRPESRRPDDVADYVLSRIPREKVESMEELVDEVLRVCLEVADRDEA